MPLYPPSGGGGSGSGAAASCYVDITDGVITVENAVNVAGVTRGGHVEFGNYVISYETDLPAHNKPFIQGSIVDGYGYLVSALYPRAYDPVLPGECEVGFALTPGGSVGWDPEVFTFAAFA